MDTEYILIYKEIISGSELAKKFRIENRHGYLPFYVRAKNTFKILSNETTELTDLNLMQGLLYAYNDKAPDGEQYQELYFNLLNDIYPRIRDVSLLIVILDVSTSIRGAGSKYFTYKILRNADKIIPKSTDIKTYFILSIWDLICENAENPEVVKYLEQLNEAFNTLEFTRIVDWGERLLIIYYNFVALYYLKRDEEINEYLPKYVDEYLSKTQLKEKIQNLLSYDRSKISISASFLDNVVTIPNSINESIAELKKLLSKETIEDYRQMTFDRFRMEHHTLGMFIRNRFGLWTGNQSLLLECKTSIPDHASGVIMKAFWEHLHNN